MARKNNDIEILVRLASKGNFDEAQKQLDRLKTAQEGSATGGVGAIGKLKGAWQSWTSMAEVSAASIKKSFLTALGPIGLLIVVVETVVRVFGKLISFVKDYQKAQKEVNDTIKASSDALAVAQRHKEKYTDATGVELLGKAIKAHEADLQAVAKNYEEIGKKVEGAGQQWWNILGVTSQASQRYQEQLALLAGQRQESERQLQAKQQQLETEKALEKAAKEREAAETAIADRLAKLTLDDTAFKQYELNKQLTAYEKAGADRVLIDQLRVEETGRIADEGIKKREDIDDKLASRIAQMTLDEVEQNRLKLEEEVAAYELAGANKTLIDEFRAAETKRIGELDTRNKETQAKKQETIETQRINAAKGALNDLASFQNAKNKELAAIGKASATVAALISTYEGAQKAYTSLAGLPIVGNALGIAAAAVATAAGMARVAAIQGVELEAGGVGMGSPDGTIVKFAENSKAEAVLPLTDPRAMRAVGEAISSAGGSGGGSVYYNTFVLPGLEAARDPATARAILEILADQMERGDPAARRAAVTIARRAHLDRNMAV